MGDLADCLLLAYEHIADIAQDSAEIAAVFDKSRTTLTIEERIAARRHLLPDMEFDVTETPENFYLLASVPGFSSGQIEIGLDPQWVAIFAHRDSNETPHGGATVSRADDKVLAAHIRNRKPVMANPPAGEINGRSCADSRARQFSACADRDGTHSGAQQFQAPSKILPERLFGARELSAPIDPGRATAVVSNGLLAVKLPKAPIR